MTTFGFHEASPGDIQLSAGALGAALETFGSVNIDITITGSGNN
jgi:hypothetical protein